MGHRNLCFQNQRRQSVKEGTTGTKDAREYDKGHRRVNQSQTYRTITAQPWVSFTQWSEDSLERRLEGLKPEEFVSTVNRHRCRKRIRKDSGESEMKGTFGKEWYLPHHPVLNPNKLGKVRRVCNSASKYKDICLNDKLLAGPDLLHGLIGTIFDSVKDQ